MNYNIKIP